MGYRLLSGHHGGSVDTRERRHRPHQAPVLIELLLPSPLWWGQVEVPMLLEHFFHLLLGETV